MSLTPVLESGAPGLLWPMIPHDGRNYYNTGKAANSRAMQIARVTARCVG